MLSPFLLKVLLIEDTDTQFAFMCVCVCVRAAPPATCAQTVLGGVTERTASHPSGGRDALMGEDFISGRP